MLITQQLKHQDTQSHFSHLVLLSQWGISMPLLPVVIINYESRSHHILFFHLLKTGLINSSKEETNVLLVSIQSLLCVQVNQLNAGGQHKPPDWPQITALHITLPLLQIWRVMSHHDTKLWRWREKFSTVGLHENQEARYVVQTVGQKISQVFPAIVAFALGDNFSKRQW